MNTSDGIGVQLIQDNHKFVYIDESMENYMMFVPALVVDTAHWHEVLDHLTNARRELNSKYGMYVRKEFHSSPFLGGRGRYFQREVGKALRVQIFIEHLERCLACDHIRVFNCAFPQNRIEWGFERLLTRMQNTFGNGYNDIFPNQRSTFTLFMDEGKDLFFRTLTRRLRRHNPVPSKFTGYRDVQITRMLEDPVMLVSDHSLFIQLADMIAFTLLAHYRPRPTKLEPVNTAFQDFVAPHCVTIATRNNPFGIIEIS